MTICNCKQARTLLMAYLDSELDAVHALRVAKHLERCAACRERFAAEQLIEARLVETLSTETMPADVWQRISERLEHAAPSEASPRVLRWIPTAAAALVLVAAGLLLRSSLLDSVGEASGSMVEFMVASHRAQIAEPSEARSEWGSGSLQQLLVEAGLDGVPVPKNSVLNGHPVELLGARNVELAGVPAVNARFECCGEPVSVFVVDRNQLNAERAVEIESEQAELRVVTRNHGQLLVGVISQHHSPLDAFWGHTTH